MKTTRPSNRSGFALRDVCAAASIVMILALLSPGAIGRNRSTSKTAVCLNHFQQLIRAWSLYAQDNSGRLVENYHGGSAIGGAGATAPGVAPWALGWLDWTTSRDNTNIALLTDPKYSRLATYTLGNPKIFKCPSDKFISPIQRSAGWTERVRSVSSSVGIGGGNAENGPWDSAYAHIRTLGSLTFPSPSETFVYIEEHPDSMNDPGFFTMLNQWVDFPANFHNGGANLAFFDGHAETHKWVGPSATRAVRFSSPGGATPASDADNQDHKWLSYHTARRTENNF